VSADGAVAACKKVPQGAFKTHTTRAGAEVYFHRLRDDALTKPTRPGRRPKPRKESQADASPINGKPPAERADVDLRHRVYSIILAHLTLSDAHRENLRRRGLTDTEIEQRQYRTYPPDRDRLHAAMALRYAILDWADVAAGDVDRVPGVNGMRLLGWPGFLIPVRVALDADASTNKSVAACLLDCSTGLAKRGFAVELERWDPANAKGIDDLLAIGKRPEVITGDTAQAAAQDIAAAAAVTVAATEAAAENDPAKKPPRKKATRHRVPRDSPS
jgi:hypothetical protein